MDGQGQGEVCTGGGSDPVAPHLPRRLMRRWSPPPPTQKCSMNIRHGYYKHLQRIQTGSVPYPSFIFNRSKSTLS
jgi:hypothetical protein